MRDINQNCEKLEHRLREAGKIHYPFNAFCADLQACLAITKPAAKAEFHPNPSILEYFQSRYPAEGARDKMMRCLAAGSYWERNKDRLNVGNISVVSEGSSLVRGHLISVLWIGWCRDDSDWKTYDPPVEAIIATCEAISKPN